MQRSSYIGSLDLNGWYNEGDIQQYVDTANSRYQYAAWRDYGEWDMPQMSKTWSSLVSDIQLPVRPVILGASEAKPLLSTPELQMASDRIPKMGRAIAITEADIQELMEYQAAAPNFYDMIRERFFNKVSSLVGGYHSQFTSFIYQIISTGKVTVLPTDGLGIPITIDFRFGNKQMKTTGGKAWFLANGNSNPDADPIKDLIKMVKDASDDLRTFDHFEMSRTLWSKFINHDKVVKNLTARSNPAYSGSDPYPMTDQEKANILQTGFGLPPIIVIDEQSMTEKDGKPVVLPPSFNENVVVLMQSGDQFRIKNSISMYTIDVNPSTNKAFLEGGRIAFLYEYSSEPFSVKTSSEAWAMPIPRDPRNFVILDTTK